MSDGTELVRAPRGAPDLLPDESWRWQSTVRLAQDTFAQAGYAPIDTPIFEHTPVFERGVGATSEVVSKQMYTFEDRGGRSLTLRPEGTAPVVRAVLEHGLDRGPLPVKLAYAGPMFRQERPQKGRRRQFFQVGIEALGSSDPSLDAEVIEVGARFLGSAGVRHSLLMNSIGHPDESCRLGYVKVLREFLEERAGDLAFEDRERIATNPLRTLDSKEPATVAATEDAPRISEYICDACRLHFKGVTGALGDLDVDYKLDERLVRGLDYYARTAFEYIVGELGSQNAAGGGGRYDGLSELLGGGPLPGIGFAIGIDRVLLAQDEQRASLVPGRGVHVYVVAREEEARRVALRLVTRLRRGGIGADLDFAGRGLKGQMKGADRSGATWAVILGERELSTSQAVLRDLGRGEQETVELDEIEARVRP